ncbi:MAG: CoA transferase [Chloroflexi bacterium]|nr:CoA transferase [Chloroflexota bacterium]MDA1241472.1 CoA transferase [Chloroflexota bacterium]
MAQPFSGVRVVEVGGTVAAAGATKGLSDYGATVTVVEPGAGDEVRRLGPFPGDRPHLDRGAFHLALNTGKRSVVLDHTSPSGLEVLVALAAESDLVLLHLPPEEARRVLDAIARLDDSGPTTVTLAVHGVDGPFAGRQENDLTLFAWSNRMFRHSFDGQEPLRYSAQVATLQWASTATAVAAAAIWGRRHDGVRRAIDVGGVESLAGNVDNWFVPWSFTGADTPRPAGLSRVAYPAGLLRATDGYVSFFAANEPFFSRLCKGIGHPEFATDPRFTDPAQKPAHFDEFMGHIREYLATRTRNEVFLDLQSHGVMVAPVLDVAESFEDAQVVARGSFVRVQQPGVGEHTLAGAPFRLEGAWSLAPAPALGEHTFEVLSELGYSADEQIALFRAGVAG